MLSNNFYLIGNSHTSQFKEEINIIYGYGASICGLSKNKSTLKLHEKILQEQKNNPDKLFVFFLGQSDIEFIYYYKSVKQNKKIDMELFINDLIDKYISFITKNITNKVAVLGINPTVITDNQHIFNINFRDYGNGNPAGNYDENYQYNYYLHIYNDSYDKRFHNNMEFNRKLKLKCDECNIPYIDINKYILDENNIVRSEYFPKCIDHHLLPNTKLYLALIEELKPYL